ncbi:ATP-grasp domain-containing protein [Nitrospirillum sp. BR 11828]|uniref:ATP-grasp domain-containing protein n=1 Tax=Nitrospirillum sp. BR 11828 TaxID=3104325 RepID=UPI002ACABCC7|nr:ATP-grasp domain-containing protein [Nitrospirillum sp. BR 11828]MDZ5645625.1 ATP-grasp domain-containing protein [Nitrospirillum sp. BR 11828]
MVNVLVFPAGTEVGLEIERALRHVRGINLIGATSACDHSAYTYERMAPHLPFFAAPDFIAKFEETSRCFEIEYVFPAHDDVIVTLSRWAADRPEGQAPGIISSGYATDIVARSKRATYAALCDVVATPEEYRPEDFLGTADRPLFVKPDCGQGSKGTRKIETGDPVGGISRAELLLEFLPGDEYTVDCFTDRHGELRFAGARQRVRTSNGISVSTCGIEDAALVEMARRINAALRFRGMWFFQAKRRADGTPVLMEIATRVSGAMGYFRGKGANLPLLALYDRMGKDLTVFTNEYGMVRDSALYPRYYVELMFDTVYVDLDDTLIFQDKVNSDLMGLIYHWRNQGKRVHLITRHRAVHGRAPLHTLDSLCIAASLFTSIIEVEPCAFKSSAITGKASIFIDDSTSERHDVHSKCAIPTFTCQQAVEVLSRSKGNF